MDEYRYTFDADGNMLSKENVVAHAAGKGLDETYYYNGTNELTSTTRGQFTESNLTTGWSRASAFSGSTSTQTWALDAAGNMTTNDGTSETFNAGDQIQTIGGGAAAPAYDQAGNMTTTPEPGSTATALDCVYDAWNRLVSVAGASSSVTYQYDGTGRLVKTSVAGGNTTYSFYDAENLIQTCVGGTAPADAQQEYVWSLRGDKVPLLRDDRNRLQSGLGDCQGRQSGGGEDLNRHTAEPHIRYFNPLCRIQLGVVAQLTQAF